MNKKLIKITVVLLTALSIWSCGKKEKPSNNNMEKLIVSDYGISPAGDSIKKYTLINKNGMRAQIINYGAIITSLTAPDKDGKFGDIVLGYTKPEDYFNGNPYFFGALIGRYGNRIANAQFQLDGKTYTLDKNDGPNHLHGGKNGFYTKFWKVDSQESNRQSLKLSYTSKDGEEGYPGKLDVTVIYTLTDDNALEIKYSAITDKKTVINLTQHSYFNLSGNFTQPITDHELQLNASQFLPVNETLIPTGELKSVAGTPFDFNNSKLIGKDISAVDDQLKKGNGYDHCWILNGKGLRTVGRLYHPASGRIMEVITDQPAVQFYSGNFLDGKYDTKTGGKNEFRTGLCLETQHYPDSPNQESFPSVILKPGQVYETKTIYKFSIKK